jgi:hypothetical protein
VGPGSKFRHGALELNFRDRNHPIARGFPEKTRFIDESYWALTGDAKRIHLLADSLEENEPQPLMWTTSAARTQPHRSRLRLHPRPLHVDV